jgi:hypothetical protein
MRGMTKSALDKRIPTYARDFLKAMLESAPLVDRTTVNEHIWAVKAVDFAEALVEELKRRGHNII